MKVEQRTNNNLRSNGATPSVRGQIGKREKIRVSLQDCVWDVTSLPHL